MEPIQNKSIWNASGIAGLIFGFIVFLITMIGSYITIHSEPSGSLFGANMIASTVGCLIGVFGGAMGVKLYINQFGKELKIGKGALIGLATGFFMAIISQILSLLWPLIDGSFVNNLMEAMIANIELMEQLPSAQKQEMIDATYTQMQNYFAAGTIIKNLLIGVAMFGLLNMLSGMLAAKLMGEAPAEELL